MGAEKVMKAYTTGRYDLSDSDFFYDYVALLGTLQNQYFFDEKQNKMLLKWLGDAIGADNQPPPPAPVVVTSKADLAKLASLQDENAKLHAELAKLQEASDAVMMLKSIKFPIVATDVATEEKERKPRRRGGKGKGKEKDR